MKAKFKKDFIKSFNEKYNYENESLLKEITPKQPILKRRPLCYLSIILITMLLSVSITYVVVRNRFIHNSEDYLYNKILNYVNDNFSNNSFEKTIKINFDENKKIYINVIEENEEIYFLIGIFSDVGDESLAININNNEYRFTKSRKLEIFEIKVEKTTEYNISLAYYMNNEIQLKFVENIKI